MLTGIGQVNAMEALFCIGSVVSLPLGNVPSGLVSQTVFMMSKVFSMLLAFTRDDCMRKPGLQSLCKQPLLVDPCRSRSLGLCTASAQSSAHKQACMPGF